MRCPHCHSLRIVTRDYAQKTCGVLGALVGAAAATDGSRSTSRTGDALGALMGAGSGVVAGLNLGQMIDERILNNYVCRDCRAVFRQPLPEAVETGPYLGELS